MKGMLLGLHSLLFQTKVKAAAASMTRNFALFVSDSLHSRLIVHYSLASLHCKTAKLSFSA